MNDLTLSLVFSFPHEGRVSFRVLSFRSVFSVFAPFVFESLFRLPKKKNFFGVSSYTAEIFPGLFPRSAEAFLQVRSRVKRLFLYSAL